ncbi:MAG: ABC transporter permease [Candidatus Kaistia colombiensis]|nr:MAG: ABC transporter permease [Kaistia sp.]
MAISTHAAGNARGAGLAKALRRHPSLNILLVFLALQIVCIAASLLMPNDFRYLSTPNIETLLRAVPQLGIIALGVGILMVAGEFDLSVGAVFTFSALIMADVYNAGAPLPVALGAAIAVALAVGFVNGILVLRFAITSFIATLGTMMMLRGIVLFISNAQSSSFRPSEAFQALVAGQVGFVPAQFIWLVGFTIAAYLLLERHRFGNRIFAVGGSRDAANAVGVQVNRVKLAAFMLSSVSASIAGIISTTRVNSVSPIQGQGLELQAIAACVIGGVALTGGRGSVLGMFLGAALIYTVQDILLLTAAPGYYLDAFVGLIIVVAAILNRHVLRQE